MKPKTTTKKKPAAPIQPGQPTSTGSQADYEAFLPAARALPAGAIVPMRADLSLALQNIQVGVTAVLAEKDRMAKLPETKTTDLSSLPRIALAVIFADTQIERTAPTGDLQKLLTRGHELRALLLKTADSLAEAGLIPRAAVDKVRAGHGKLDAARDCIELAAIFTKGAAALKGKHPISAAQIKEAALVGTSLLQMLKPARARRAAASPSEAAGDRDRLWTLIVQRHDALWRAGAYLFGREAVETKVPSLQASRGGRGKKAPASSLEKGKPAPAGQTP